MKSRFYAEIGSENREKGWQTGNLLQFIVAPDRESNGKTCRGRETQTPPL